MALMRSVSNKMIRKFCNCCMGDIATERAQEKRLWQAEVDEELQDLAYQELANDPEHKAFIQAARKRATELVMGAPERRRRRRLGKNA